MLHKSLKHKNRMTYIKKLQHNRAKLCFLVSKWLVDWVCAKSMVDPIWFFFCQTLYIWLSTLGCMDTHITCIIFSQIQGTLPSFYHSSSCFNSTLRQLFLDQYSHTTFLNIISQPPKLISSSFNSNKISSLTSPLYLL